MRALALALLALGCASSPPPETKTVVVERKVYVFVPEKSVPMPPGPPIAESPLVVAAENHRREHTQALVAASPPPPTPDRPLVYAGNGYGYGWGNPSPYVYPSHTHSHDGDGETKVVIVHRDHGPRHKRDHVRHHSKNIQEKRIERCGRRKTSWAQDRCIRRAAR